MILIDFSQFLISSVFAQMGHDNNKEVNEDMLRHILLNTIRATKKQYKEYGEVVFACDDKNYWRKDIFPYYKASRKKTREDSGIDWTAIFACMDTLKQELKENFPYKVIQLPRTEADDIIAVLAKKYHQCGILIASQDKDYMQLQKYKNIKQYSNVTNLEVKCSDPAQYLIEHIIKGDVGDGIPNVLSPDNSFIMKIRQKPVTKKRLDQIINDFDSLDTETKTRYKRNKYLIDFDEIPQDIQDNILKAFDEQEYGNRSKIFNYFMEKRLKNLMECISDF
jgi:hypothetical protein